MSPPTHTHTQALFQLSPAQAPEGLRKDAYELFPALDGRRLVLAGRALERNRRKHYTFHFIYRKHCMSGLLSESMPLLAIFTCKPFEQDNKVSWKSFS